MEQSKKSNKKKLFSIIAVVAILATALIIFFDISDTGLGAVTKVSASMKNDNAIELKIKYKYPSGGYSVREVPEDEGEYIGDGMIDYDGSLGKYRIMVKFGDVEPSGMLSLKLADVEYIELMDSPSLKAKIAHPSDHGFVLYIGSDTPIHVENTENGEFKNALKGTINIPVTID